MSHSDLRKTYKISKNTIDNGLEVYVIPKTNVPLVTVNLAYRVGSYDEYPDKSGMAHLFEHLMFEGTKAHPKGEFDLLCSVSGGTNNAYTIYDFTSYYMTLPANKLDLALYLESDRMKEFALSEETLANQKKVVTEEIMQTVEEQPYGKWRELLADIAYSKECGYRTEVHGLIDHVRNVTIDDCRDFFNCYYKPANAVLIVSGNVDPDEVFKKADKHFSHIKSDKRPDDKLFLPEYRFGNTSASFSENVPLNGVFLSFHFDGLNIDEGIQADILSNIAGVGRSSRLYSSLVYDRQIASQVGCYTDKRFRSSLFTLYAIVNKPTVNIETLNENLQDEISKLKKKITTKELAKAKAQLSTLVAYELQKTSGIADLALNSLLFNNDISKFFELPNKINSVTIEELKDFADRIFCTENEVRINALMAE